MALGAIWRNNDVWMYLRGKEVCVLLLLGTAMAVGREISGAAGPSPMEESARERVCVEEVDTEDDGVPHHCYQEKASLHHC